MWVDAECTIRPTGNQSFLYCKVENADIVQEGYVWADAGLIVDPFPFWYAYVGGFSTDDIKGMITNGVYMMNVISGDPDAPTDFPLDYFVTTP